MVIETLKLSDLDPHNDITIEVKMEEGQTTLTMEDSDYDTARIISIILKPEDVVKLGEWLLRKRDHIN